MIKKIASSFENVPKIEYFKYCDSYMKVKKFLYFLTGKSLHVNLSCTDFCF